MKISELIKELEKVKSEHGDLDVAYNDGGLNYDVENIEISENLKDKYIELN